MITPQQIDQVSFSKASFGGYNMQQVDEFLEPLTEDYVTLYKENALLKSKMRVLASKLEEYRKSGVEAKTASGDAKAAADKMLLETKAKCDRMLKEATAKAQAITASAVPAAPAAAGSNAEALIAAENARVEEARLAANAKIAEIQEQMRALPISSGVFTLMIFRCSIIYFSFISPFLLLQQRFSAFRSIFSPCPRPA